MSKAIRFILTLALIYGAYTETGVFTALSLLLIFVAIELQGWLTKRTLNDAYCNCQSRYFQPNNPTRCGLCGKPRR